MCLETSMHNAWYTHHANSRTWTTGFNSTRPIIYQYYCCYYCALSYIPVHFFFPSDQKPDGWFGSQLLSARGVLTGAILAQPFGLAVRSGGSSFFWAEGERAPPAIFFFFNKKKGLWYFQISSNIYVDTSYYVCCDKETVRRVSDRSSKIQLDILCPVPYVYDETDVLHLFVYLLCVRAMTYFKRFFGPSGGKPNETPIYIPGDYVQYVLRPHQSLVGHFFISTKQPPGKQGWGMDIHTYMYRSTTMYVPPVGVIWHACVPARSSCTLFAWRTLAARLSHYVDRGWWELTSVVL